MKKRWTYDVARLLFGLLAVVLVTSMMCTGVMAVPAMEESAEDDASAIRWRMYEDGTVLQGGDTVYGLYRLPVGYWFEPATIYYFSNSIYNGEYYNDVRGLSHDPDVVWLGDGTLYVTAAGEAALDDFIGGEVALHRLDVYGDYSQLSEKFMADLASMAGENASRAESYDVTVLATTADVYEITAWDAYDCVYTVEGAIYALRGGTYAYVDYSTLDNSYFDAEGSFSYRKGSVSLIPLDGSVAEKVEDAIDDARERKMNYAYENDVFDAYDEEDGLIGVAISMVLSDILLPIAPLVVGLILPHSQKMGYPKRWYILSAVSLAWLVVGVIRLALLLT